MDTNDKLDCLMILLQERHNWDWGTEGYSRESKERILNDLKQHLELAARTLNFEIEEEYEGYAELNEIK